MSHTIQIFGDIGLDVRAQDVVDELEGIPASEHVIVEMASRGGSILEGIHIHNALAAHRGLITMQIQFAFSIAAFITQSGDKIEMVDNGRFQIHEASIMPLDQLTKDELRNQANLLESFENDIIKTLSARSGLDRESILDLMKEDRMLTADETKDFGFIDEIIEPSRMVAMLEDFYFKKPKESKMFEKKKLSDLVNQLLNEGKLTEAQAKSDWFKAMNYKAVKSFSETAPVKEEKKDELISQLLGDGKVTEAQSKSDWFTSMSYDSLVSYAASWAPTASNSGDGDDEKECEKIIDKLYSDGKLTEFQKKAEWLNSMPLADLKSFAGSAVEVVNLKIKIPEKTKAPKDQIDTPKSGIAGVKTFNNKGEEV